MNLGKNSFFMDSLDNLCSVAQAAKRLNLSPFYVYRLAETGLLLSVRIGRRRLIRQSDLERVIQEGLEINRNSLDPSHSWKSRNECDVER